MKVTSLLRTIKIGPKLWMLTEDFYFQIGLSTYRIPKGFLTDGASTPRFLWTLCPPMSGLTAEYAVVHDFLYSKNCMWWFEREDMDKAFRSGMIKGGVARARAEAIYWGVRLGGASSYCALPYPLKANEKTVYPALWAGKIEGKPHEIAPGLFI